MARGNADQPPGSDRRIAGARTYPWRKTLVVFFVLSAIAVALIFFRPYLQLDRLAEQETALRAWGQQHPGLVFLAAALIYVVVTGLSIPGATVLTLAYSWYFGFWRALLVVSFASTAGATVAFLLSRYLFRDMLAERFGETYQRVNRAVEQEGPFYLFVLRLTPVVPFFVVNAVMGLTSLPARTFWWVSQLGMLPGTIVYVYAGSSAPSLRSLAEEGLRGIPVGRLAIAFFLIGCFPLAARALVKKLRAK